MLFLKRIPPDCIFVVFSDRQGRSIISWQQGGLVFVPPWRSYGQISCRARAFVLDQTEAGLPLPGGVPLRFSVAVCQEETFLKRALLRFGLVPEKTLEDEAQAIIRSFLGVLRPEQVLPAKRPQLETNILVGLDEELRRVGLCLLNANLDGIFGDAPACLYT